MEVQFVHGVPETFQADSVNEGKPVPFGVQFSYYTGGQAGEDVSGAYLFIPSGASRPFLRGIIIILFLKQLQIASSW